MRNMFMGCCGVGFVMLGTGCPLLKVEVSFDEAHITYKGLEVPGVPADAGRHLVRSFVADELATLEGFDEVLDVGGTLELVGAQLVAVSGIADFSFIDRVNVIVASGHPDATLPAIPFFTCDGDCAPVGTALAIPPAAQVNALAYIKTGSLLVEIEVDGALPTEDWTVDIDLTFKGQLEGTIEP